jgi:diguanylate cyclase (GGDEF)-like protein
LLLLLSTDAVYGIQQLDGTFTSGSFLDGMWAGYYLLIGAMALHPSMRELAEPSTQLQPSAGKSRLIGLAVASLMAPASLVIQVQRHAPLDVQILAGGAAAMFLLVLARMWLLVSAQEVAAVTDPLTELYNRRFLEQHIRLEGVRHLRSGQPLAMFMIDVDHFKSVNDSYGHPVGDQVLREVARRIRVNAREADVVARIGGEEFAVLAPGLDEGSLVSVAERLRAAVAERPIEVGPDTSISVTVSIGVAALPLHASRPDELVVLADRALYGAKQAGRNRILIGSTQLPAPRQTVSKFDIDNTVLDFLCRVEDEMEGYQTPNEHSSAVGRWAGIVALHAGFDDESRARCELAGRLHDIGKIVVPPEILAKSDPLTAEEWRIVSMHADHGSRLLSAFGASEATAQVVAQHH